MKIEIRIGFRAKNDANLAYHSTELARNHGQAEFEAKAAEIPVDIRTDGCHGALLHNQHITYVKASAVISSLIDFE